VYAILNFISRAWKKFKKNATVFENGNSMDKLKTLRVVLPKLGSFKSLKYLTQMQSQEPFQCPSLHIVIDAHWMKWAKFYFS